MLYNVQVLSVNNEDSLRRTMLDIGVTPEGIELMVPKGRFYIVRVSGLSCKALNLLKQEMLSKGGEVAVPRHAASLDGGIGEAVLMGTAAHFKRLLPKLELQAFGLSELAKEISASLARYDRRSPAVSFGKTRFDWGLRTYIMGIMNMTPDSFSGDGLIAKTEDEWLRFTLEQAERFKEEGADILDVGGESTRPGAIAVGEEEEMQRILPAVRELCLNSTLPISIDTQKASVAKAALELGAHIINDIWGLQGDPLMAEVIGSYGAGVVIMHNKTERQYHDLMGEIIEFLARSIDVALKNNIPEEKIWIDPGIGFGKTREQNLEVIDRLEELRVLGYPVLLGTSRKSVIGLTLDLPVDQRVEGTAATVALGIAKGVDIVRVHDVKAMARTAKMADAVVRRRLNG